MGHPKLTGYRRLPASLIDKDQQCQNCHQPGATKMCFGCKISDIGSICTRYCNEACQKQHWTLHKPVCRDRRRLARAVRIITEVWETFSALAYDRHLTYEIKKDGVICAHDDPQLTDRVGWTGETIFRDFYRDVVPHEAGDAEKLALLHDSCCAEILCAGRGLVELFLKPICSTIEEAAVRGKDLAMVIIPSDGVAKLHESHFVLYVELHSGEDFAIDMTGAQFGWQEKLYMWDIYDEHRATFKRSLDLGNLDGKVSVDMIAYDSNTIQKQAYKLRLEICETTEAAIEAFFAVKRTDVRSLLSTPADANFEAQKTELIDLAVTCIKDTIHEITVVQGRGRWFVELTEVAPGQVTEEYKVVDQEDFAKKMAKAYLTQEEVEELRSLSLGKPGGLKAALVRAMYDRQKKHDCLGQQGYDWKPKVYNII